ncbi:MAG: hypothetical protein IPH86_17385 [bacterium]|nr:hypothetical protein [bacterium]
MMTRASPRGRLPPIDVIAFGTRGGPAGTYSHPRLEVPFAPAMFLPVERWRSVG